MSATAIDFIKTYPNYCRTCKGLGEIVYYDDPSPDGVSLSSGTMEFSDPCPDCIEKDICPLCAGKLQYNEKTGLSSCFDCGYFYNPLASEQESYIDSLKRPNALQYEFETDKKLMQLCRERNIFFSRQDKWYTLNRYAAVAYAPTILWSCSKHGMYIIDAEVEAIKFIEERL